MTSLLLDPFFFQGSLVALAVLTPLVAFLLWRFRSPRPAWRLVLALGAFGPLALLLWGYHNLVLAVLGFDRIWSALLVLVTGAVIGFFLGRWVAAGERANGGGEE